jgi:hypothetical protein
MNKNKFKSILFDRSYVVKIYLCIYIEKKKICLLIHEITIITEIIKMEKI